jgi:hypothetical protein
LGGDADEMAPEAMPFVGDAEFERGADAILLLAVAAPVFADSRIFFKNPVFFVFGVVSPPNMPAESAGLLLSLHPANDPGPCRGESRPEL